MTAFIRITGTLLDERDDAIQIRVLPNWDIWLPRSTINPNGGLRIKRATNEVSADVASWKVQELVRDGELPPERKPMVHPDVQRKLDTLLPDMPNDLEATDERFKRKGQEKT